LTFSSLPGLRKKHGPQFWRGRAFVAATFRWAFREIQYNCKKKRPAVFSCRPIKPCGASVYNLPVSATMAATTVPAASAMESATGAMSATAVEAATA
jgi:hypothetical protein